MLAVGIKSHNRVRDSNAPTLNPPEISWSAKFHGPPPISLGPSSHCHRTSGQMPNRALGDAPASPRVTATACELPPRLVTSQVLMPYSAPANRSRRRTRISSVNRLASLSKSAFATPCIREMLNAVLPTQSCALAMLLGTTRRTRAAATRMVSTYNVSGDRPVGRALKDIVALPARRLHISV